MTASLAIGFKTILGNTTDAPNHYKNDVVEKRLAHPSVHKYIRPASYKQPKRDAVATQGARAGVKRTNTYGVRAQQRETRWSDRLI